MFLGLKNYAIGFTRYKQGLNFILYLTNIILLGDCFVQYRISISIRNFTRSLHELTFSIPDTSQA